MAISEGTAGQITFAVESGGDAINMTRVVRWRINTSRNKIEYTPMETAGGPAHNGRDDKKFHFDQEESSISIEGYIDQAIDPGWFTATDVEGAFVLRPDNSDLTKKLTGNGYVGNVSWESSIDAANRMRATIFVSGGIKKTWT